LYKEIEKNFRRRKKGKGRGGKRGRQCGLTTKEKKKQGPLSSDLHSLLSKGGGGVKPQGKGGGEGCLRSEGGEGKTIKAKQSDAKKLNIHSLWGGKRIRERKRKLGTEEGKKKRGAISLI